MREFQINFKRLSKHATEPTKEHPGDLGIDLYSAEQVSLQPGESKLVGTGIAVEFPIGFGGFIKDRSGVSSKRKLYTHAGVIDGGYRGEIKILFENANDKHQTIYIGDKIAQMVLIPTFNVNFSEVEEFKETSRNADGFGSTGD